MARSPAQEETGAARFADGLLEAGWLLALLVVPSFFDVYSRHPFEPDKAMVVRILALLMAASGLARALPAWRRWRWPRGAPLLVPVLLYLGAAALSTALSVAPRRSLWGSYTRGEGLVTLAAYLVVFTALCACLRRRDQVDRAIDAIVAGSVPVTLYGLLQAAGLDPLDWRITYQEWRVSTTVGNPVFAGSYLILTLPLTLGAFVEWRARPAPPGGEWRRTRLALYALAAALQLSVLALTGSRGPWMGGATALVAFVLLGAAVGRRRRLAAAALAAGLAAVAFVALLNVPGGPLERARQTRLLGRLAHILDRQGERHPGDRARVRVWEGALELARPRPPLPLPDGEDPRAALRPLIGYGPETLQVTFAAVYDAELARQERRNPDLSDYGVSTFDTRVADRAHNELFDSLVTGGLLGALAHLLLAVAIQVFGLGALGLLATRADRVRLAALGAAGALVGALAAGLALSWAFLGVALPLGLVAGWMAYVLACAFRRPGSDVQRPSALEVALLAALVGHFVDVQFGPSVVTGRLYFWSLTGLLVAHVALRRGGDGPMEEGPAQPAPSRAGRWRRLAGGATAGLMGAALAVTLLFDFVHVSGRQPNVLAAAGRILTDGSAPARAVTALGAASVLALVLLEAGRRRGPRAAAVLGALLVVALLGLAFAATHVAALARTAEARKVGDLAWSLGGVFARYVLWLLALAALLGASLVRRGPRAPRAVEARAAALTAAVLAAALATGLPPALASVGADVMLRFAAAMQEKGFVADGLALFDRAADTAPWEAANFRSQGEAYLAASRRTGSPVRRQEYLRRAETAFGRARVLDPLGPDNHVNLARLARWRAELTRTPAVALREADEASRHYAAAARLFPANTLLLNEWAELDFLRRRDFAAAEEKLRRSLRLDPSFDYTYAALGDMYMARAKAAVGDPREDYRRAADAYAQAWERRRSLKAVVSLGLAYERLGEKEKAVDAYNRALGMNPPHETAWAIHEQLAGLYLAFGNRQEAERHARDALGSSPERERATLLERLRSAGLVTGG